MDLFLSIGSLNANSIKKNTQTRNSKRSSALFISNSKPSVPAVQTSSDKASATTKLGTSVRPLPTPHRTRRVTILGPDARPLNDTHHSAQECAPTRLTSPASAAGSKSWKTFQSRQPRPSQPPTSWKGGFEDGSDDEDNVPDILRDERKQTTSTVIDFYHLNTNHQEQATKKSPGELTESIASSETRSESSLFAAKSLTSREYSVLETEDNMLPDQATQHTCRVSNIGPDPPRPSQCSSGVPVRDKGTKRILQPNTREAEAALLPDPEIAYGQKFFYTTCPHASPPCSRPLNVQPTLTTYQEDLLRYAPFHLRVHPLEPTPEIYILEGACSQCDLAARREAELRVLSKYKSKIDVLSTRLYELQGEVDIDSPTLPRECYSGISQPVTSPDPATDNTGIVFTPEVIEQILSLEADLELIIKRRDREIKFVWRGYTARWGPATLGVFRSNIYPVSRAMQNAATSNAESTLSQSANTSDTESTISAGMKSSPEDPNSSSFTDSSSATSFSSGAGATAPSSTRRQRGPWSSSVSLRDTPQSRYSNGKRSISLPSPIGGTKQDGRMHIDWVRRDCGSAVVPVKTPRRPTEQIKPSEARDRDRDDLA